MIATEMFIRVGLDLELELIFININPCLPAFLCQHIIIALLHSSSHQAIHDLKWKVGGPALPSHSRHRKPTHMLTCTKFPLLNTIPVSLITSAQRASQTGEENKGGQFQI